MNEMIKQIKRKELYYEKIKNIYKRNLGFIEESLNEIKF